MNIHVSIGKSCAFYGDVWESKNFWLDAKIYSLRREVQMADLVNYKPPSRTWLPKTPDQHNISSHTPPLQPWNRPCSATDLRAGNKYPREGTFAEVCLRWHISRTSITYSSLSANSPTVRQKHTWEKSTLNDLENLKVSARETIGQILPWSWHNIDLSVTSTWQFYTHSDTYDSAEIGFRKI